MSENNCSSAILATKHFGFKSGQMQAVVAKGSGRLIERLQDVQTDAEFFKAWNNESGGKGVIVNVVSDEDLPIDAVGNRADLVCPEGSMLNRTTNVDLFNIWLDEQTAKLATSGFSADDIINSRAVALTMLKLPCGSRQMMDTDIEQKLVSIKHLPISPPDPNFDGDEMERALCDLKHNAEFVPKIALSHLMKKHEMIVTHDQLPQSLKKSISPRFAILLQKSPSGFEHKCRRGFTALRFNGLLKQKCKKGARKHYSKR